MMQHYNFVLTPIDQADSFVDLAQKCCSERAATYLLNGIDSLPHLTLCQVQTDQPAQVLQTAFEEILPKLVSQLPLKIEFEKEIRVQAGRGVFDAVNWVALAPTAAFKSQLQRIHDFVRQHVENKGFACQNSHGLDYDPHVTLSNVLKSQPFEIETHLPTSLQAQFSFALGEGDQNGQLKKIIMRQVL